MKKLIFVNGTMGAGKSATCQALLRLLQPSVFLDGDWCWTMNPFIVNEETKQMVLKNICFMLNSFLKCSEYESVIFCWVMHQEEIMDQIHDQLKLKNTEIYKFTLTLTETALTKRLMREIAQNKRDHDILEKSVARLGLYDNMNTSKIDVSTIDPLQAAMKIVELIRFRSN